jgi:hypothetical protein
MHCWLGQTRPFPPERDWSIMIRFSVAALMLAAFASPAAAADEDFELWINPTVEIALDGDTAVEVELSQRLRDAGAGRPDTYYGRILLSQEVAEGIGVAGGVERRINTPGAEETRLIQQVTARSGIWRARLRAEQRFVDDAGRMGLRIRPRIGVSAPLDAAGKWQLDASVEGFLTLRSTGRGGQDGLTGLRTRLGFAREVSDHLTVGLAYLRQQDFRDGRPDLVAHVPLVSIDLSF